MSTFLCLLPYINIPLKPPENIYPPAIQCDRGVTTGWVRSIYFTSLSAGCSLGWDFGTGRISHFTATVSLLVHFGLPSSTILRFRWSCRCFAHTREMGWVCSRWEIAGSDLASPGRCWPPLPERVFLAGLLSPLDSPLSFWLHCTGNSRVCQYVFMDFL